VAVDVSLRLVRFENTGPIARYTRRNL